jgi:hypothetical protein
MYGTGEQQFSYCFLTDIYEYHNCILVEKNIYKNFMYNTYVENIVCDEIISTPSVYPVYTAKLKRHHDLRTSPRPL